MYGFIYLTTNKITGKKYIGMCKSTHEKYYFGSGSLITSAIKKYGKENFERIILQECDSFNEMCLAEKYWISYYNAVESQDFYNLHSGGVGGDSDYMRNYWMEMSEDRRKACRNWCSWKKRGSNNPMLGKKHSENTKKIIGSKSVNRNWHKPNHHGKNNPRAKRVEVTIDANKYVYECLKDFSDEIKYIPYSTLKRIARDGRYSKKYNLKITYV
jgi:group I intron endonuclease